MPDFACRLAKNEQKVETLEETLEKILVTVERIDNNQTRQKGFIAGVVFVVTGLAGLAAFIINKYL